MVSVALVSDSQKNGIPFLAPEVEDLMVVSILKRGDHCPLEEYISYPLPFRTEVSSFFLSLLQIEKALQVSGSSPLMFIYYFPPFVQCTQFSLIFIQEVLKTFSLGLVAK